MIKEFVHLMEVRTQSQETRDGERTEADTIQSVLSTEALPSLCGSQGLDHGPRHAAAVMPSLDFRWLPALSMGHRIRLSRSLIPSWEYSGGKKPVSSVKTQRYPESHKTMVENQSCGDHEDRQCRFDGCASDVPMTTETWVLSRHDRSHAGFVGE